MYKFTHDFFNDRGKVWSSLQLPTNLNCLEVGCYEGRSTIWILENLVGDHGKLDIVDELHHSYVDNLYHNVKQWEDKITYYKGDALETIGKLPHEEQYDFIYLDAAKSAADNAGALFLLERLLKIDGILVVDDYFFELDDDSKKWPMLGINSFASCSQLCKLFQIEHGQAFFKKIQSKAIYK